MKLKEAKSLERFLRDDRISGSNNGRTLSTRVQKDKKKTYNRQKEKRNRNDSSYFVLYSFTSLHLHIHPKLLLLNYTPFVLFQHDALNYQYDL